MKSEPHNDLKTRKKILKKNISYLLSDVKPPLKRSTKFTRNTVKTNASLGLFRRNSTGIEIQSISRSHKRRPVLKTLSMAVLTVVITGSMFLYSQKEKIDDARKAVYQNYLSSLRTFESFNLKDFSLSIQSADQNLKYLGNISYPLKFSPIGGNIPLFIDTLRNFNSSALRAIGTVDQLESRGFDWLFGDGKRLNQSLDRLKDDLDSITKSSSAIRNGLGSIESLNAVSGKYLSLHSDLKASVSLIDGIINLLNSDQKLALIFSNDSEMRATGGFNGSYATVSFNDGQISNIDVNDVMIVDSALSDKIIPPKPLQAIATNWGARDANWFFDFKTSAEKTLGFIEKSDLYLKENTKFSGLISINHKTVSDILKIVGPVELPEYKTVLDGTNFSKIIQNEVSRDSTIRGSERKDILKIALDSLLTKIKNSTPDQKKAIISALAYRAKNKDIQVYFHDNRLESFAEKYGFSGSAYNFSGDQFGDYLAVVNSNIGGEKSDAVMRQKISLKSRLETSGSVTNELFVYRHHGGVKSDPVFYRATNQSFIRVMTPKDSGLDKVSGNYEKYIVAKANYKNPEYKSDHDVELSDNGEESGKKVFGYWLRTPIGKDGTLNLSYSRNSRISDKFRFIFERQSGVDSLLDYQLTAPAGYVFKETGTSSYAYVNDNPPARLIIDLNLRKI